MRRCAVYKGHYLLETLQKIEPTDKVKMDDTGRQSAGNPDQRLQWLGGFIDGEGSFCLQNRFRGKDPKTGKTRSGYFPIMSISNTHKPTVERIAEILSDYCVGHWVTNSTHKSRKHRDTFCVDVRGMKRMQRFLPMITPYLFTKREQAETLLEFVNLRMGGWPGKPYGDAEHVIFLRLKDLNRRGSSETIRAPEPLAQAV